VACAHIRLILSLYDGIYVHVCACAGLNRMLVCGASRMLYSGRDLCRGGRCAPHATAHLPGCGRDGARAVAGQLGGPARQRRRIARCANHPSGLASLPPPFPQPMASCACTVPSRACRAHRHTHMNAHTGRVCSARAPTPAHRKTDGPLHKPYSVVYKHGGQTGGWAEAAARSLASRAA
jgi:hypothetical protein